MGQVGGIIGWLSVGIAKLLLSNFSLRNFWMIYVAVGGLYYSILYGMHCKLKKPNGVYHTFS